MLGSSLLFVINKQKQQKEHEWRVLAVRTSSFPPPAVSPVVQQSPISPDKNHSLQQPLMEDITTSLPVVLPHEIVEKLSKREKDNTQDNNLQVTSMTKQQLDDYLEHSSATRYHSNSGSNLSNNSTMVYSEAFRLASLDPEEVVYINSSQWFHPSACEFYPSQTTVGEELLMTIKGSWILKKPGIKVPSEYTYQVVSKKDAFIFLESNGFTEIAQALAPHNPSCEV